VSEAPLAGRSGSAIYRDLGLGDTIEILDEFQVGPDEWMKVGECRSISARWMIGSPYYPNVYVPARRLQSPNSELNDSPSQYPVGNKAPKADESQ